jgi:hypothetical protein
MKSAAKSLGLLVAGALQLFFRRAGLATHEKIHIIMAAGVRRA